MPRRGHRTPIRHAQKSAWMRQNPFVWLEIGTYPAAYTAASVAAGIERGKAGGHIARHYSPAGTFEARTTPVEDGTAVRARYLGDTR
ncbi:hypothetical protein STAN_1825 [Streptomyces sp. CBMAI 2042]|nr:hypothetical protein STAN_1825 [Streptomyces sp. CBMAI 2042]